MNQKSIEELENDYWLELEEYPSELVKRCYEARKIPINQLTSYQLWTLIKQEIGHQFLLEKLIHELPANLDKGTLHEGDLVEASLKIPVEIWQTRPELIPMYLDFIQQHTDKIKEELGVQTLQQLLVYSTRLRLYL